MDINEYAAKLRELNQSAKERASAAILVPAANELLATIKNRIQVEGKNSNGGSIGVYSTTPIYATPEQFVKRSAFKPEGKTGRKETAKGVAHKSMYLPAGYKQLRDIQGRPTDKKNYTYRGDLMLSYVMQATAQAVLLGLDKESEALKRRGLEKKDGKVLYATKAEIEAYDKNVAEAAKEFTLQFARA